jgi:hypothetical protein
MLGFNPLASEALADSGGPSIIIVSVSSFSISKLESVVSVVSASAFNSSPFRTSFRTLNTNSLSTVDLDYVILNLSRRDKSLTILVDEQNRSLLIPGSKP